MLSALDGIEAITLIENHDIDLLCTDAVMPNLGAKGLIDYCEANAPELPIIVFSAHVDEILLRRGLSDGRHDFVQTPFFRRNLLDTVAIHLNSAEQNTP